jgi:hypothetical protein
LRRHTSQDRFRMSSWPLISRAAKRKAAYAGAEPPSVHSAAIGRAASTKQQLTPELWPICR